MNACSRSCVIYFASSGKAVYLFGDISANLTPVEAEGVFAQVQVSITCIQRIPFKKGILARISVVEVPVGKENIELELCN